LSYTGTSQHPFKRTVPWDACTNTGYVWSATGAINYRVYSAAIDADNDIEQHEHVCFNSHADSTHLVSNDKQDEDSTTANANDNQVTDDFTYSETREENIADFFTKELPTQPTNIIKDKTNLFLSRVHKVNYFTGTIDWNTYLLHTYGFSP
jgi:hypothetical protein